MFTVTPIGSCRITTPLRRGQSVHGFNLNMDRCYGYCHSPAEAVQMARFMQGHTDIPEDVWPLVSRKHELSKIAADAHVASDLYVVELASAKEVTIDGVSIQLNYLNATYPEFFADTGRAQTFWSLAECADRAALPAFLDAKWSATSQQKSEAAVLGKMRLQLVTRESLRRDIETLAEILPDVLFVSHVDARKPDGQTIKSRSNFISMIEEEVRGTGCKFYNPTDLMAEFGQTAAIDDESTSLAHFTDAFAEGVVDDWMRQVIAPKTDAAVQQGFGGALDRHLLPQISKACDGGRFVEALARLHSLSNHGLGVEPLLDTVIKAQEQAQTAFVEERAPALVDDLTPDERLRLVRTAAQLGLFGEVLKLVGKTPDAFAAFPARDLLQVADLASKAGAIDTAIEFFLAAARLDQSRACRELAELSISQGHDILARLTSEQRSNFLAHVCAINKIKLLYLNGSAFTEAASGTTTPEDLAKIVSYVASTYGIGYSAELLASWRESQKSDHVTDAALVSILDDWVATALDCECPLERVHGLNAVLFAAPRHGTARNAMRDHRNDLALRVRAAGKKKDIDALDALAIEAAALTTEMPELDLWRARLRFGLGQYEAALQLGQSAAALLPEKIALWVLLMRAATKTNYSEKAVEFAQRVIELTCGETASLKSEAEAVLQSNAVRG